MHEARKNTIKWEMLLLLLLYSLCIRPYPHAHIYIHIIYIREKKPPQNTQLRLAFPIYVNNNLNYNIIFHEFDVRGPLIEGSAGKMKNYVQICNAQCEHCTVYYTLIRRRMREVFNVRPFHFTTPNQ